jgi:hypothetical protein
MKLIALLTGDWEDSSCEHLMIPVEMDIKEQIRQYKEWSRNIWRNPDKNDNEKFFTLSGWMIKNGARYATSEEILEVDETD